jgi:uncharacterized protein
VKLAVNYSPQAADLLERDVIEFDLYKSADWPDMVAAARVQRPVYVHFPLIAGRSNIEKVGWEHISSFLGETDTPYVNTHLAPRAGDFGLPLDTHDADAAEVLIEAMLLDITPLVERFGTDVVILENACWDPDWEIPLPVLQPELISRVVYETGCGFLLDVAHARMNAHILEMDEREYLSRLPVDRLRELHITGLHYDEEKGRLLDHFPMTPDDWSLSEWVMERISLGDWQRPWGVALEYGGTGPGFAWRSKADVLAADVPHLYQLVQSCNERVK